MIMIAQQRPGVNQPTGPLPGLNRGGQPHFTVVIIEANLLSLIAPGHHVVSRSGEFARSENTIVESLDVPQMCPHFPPLKAFKDIEGRHRFLVATGDNAVNIPFERLADEVFEQHADFPHYRGIGDRDLLLASPG